MNKVDILGWESVQFFNIVSRFSTPLVDLSLGSRNTGESDLLRADLLGEITVADSETLEPRILFLDTLESET